MSLLPRRIRKHLLGPRILKTGLAVLLCELLFIATGLGQYAAFAATSAIVAMLPSIAGSRDQLKKSLTANLLAGGVALLVGLVWGHSPLALTVATMLVLWVLVKLNLGEQAGVVSVTMIWMLSREASTIGIYIIARVGAIAFGTLLGYLVNRYIMPPNFLRKIRIGLLARADATAAFGERIAASLIDPDSFPKAEIKATIKEIREDLSLEAQRILWQQEGGTAAAIYLPLEKTKAALYVYLTELARIHKTILDLGGIPSGPIADQVARTLRAACMNMLGVCQPLLRGEQLNPHTRAVYVQAMEELKRLVEELVSDPATRALGLACHEIHTSIRHMGRRVRLCRELATGSLQEPPAEQGNAAF